MNNNLSYKVFTYLPNVTNHGVVEYVFKKLYLFIFRERGREGGREGEKHHCARETSIGCLAHPRGGGPGLAPNPSMCPDGN